MGKCSKARHAKYNNIKLHKNDTIYISSQESRHTLIIFVKYCLSTKKNGYPNASLYCVIPTPPVFFIYSIVNYVYIKWLMGVIEIFLNTICEFLVRSFHCISTIQHAWWWCVSLIKVAGEKYGQDRPRWYTCSCV